MAIYNVLHCSVGDSWTWLHLVIYKTPPSGDGIRRDLSPLQIPCGLCALITCGKYLPARVLIYWSTAVNIRRFSAQSGSGVKVDAHPGENTVRCTIRCLFFLSLFRAWLLAYIIRVNGGRLVSVHIHLKSCVSPAHVSCAGRCYWVLTGGCGSLGGQESVWTLQAVDLRL